MKSYILMLSVVCVIFAIGVIMVFETTSAEVIGNIYSECYRDTVIKYICSIFFVIISSVIAYCIGYERLIKMSPIFYGLCVLLLVMVFMPKVGMRINGACRWIKLFGTSFQPSECVKLILPIYFVKVFSDKGHFFTIGDFIKWLCVFMIPIVLVIIEPDNGTAFILLVSLVTLFFLTKIRWTYWAVPIACVGMCSVVLAMSMKHVSDRIHVYMHPEADLRGKGHQPYQAKIAIGSGGLCGKGIGCSMQKFHYLPEARSDYIAAIYAEEVGFLGIVFLVSLYAMVAMLGFKIAGRSRDVNGYYLASIYTFMIALQAFINLGIVCGILPSKGTNLPFFSHGGSSLLVNSIMIAIVINIGKYSEERACQEKLH